MCYIFHKKCQKFGDASALTVHQFSTHEFTKLVASITQGLLWLQTIKN